MLCLKARAKINWTLDILGTRQDGYHLMDMLMQSVALSDTLWLEKGAALSLVSAGSDLTAAAETDHLSASAVPFDERNLVFRAARALQTASGCREGASLRLLKRIPTGAGMGGGSADAAAALVGLNQLWGLNLPPEQLHAIGLTLGADIPFMLRGGLARVGGIGEKITPLLPPSPIWLVLLQPCDGLSTKEIFTAFDALKPDGLNRPRTEQALQALLRGDLDALGRCMNNVLEAVSVAKRPELAKVAMDLEASGAVRAMMTGSGSVVYGAFRAQAEAESACEQLKARYGYCALTRTAAHGIVTEA